MEGPAAAPGPDAWDDRSAAQERVALAWRRTVLAIVVGATVLTRLLVDRLGAVGLVAVVVAMPVGAWLWWSTGRHGRRPLGTSAALLAGVIVVLAALEAGALAFSSGTGFPDARP